MEADIRQFAASDGYRFSYRHWRPDAAKPLGYVVALHGIQSHSGWYEYSSSRLCEAGYDVRFLDRRGSGLNKQLRGHAPHHDRLVNDVVQFLGEVRAERNQQAPTAPLILLAASWSGKLAVVTAARRPELIDGLALLYPGICAKIGTRWYQRLALQLAALCGVRQANVAIPLDDPALFTGEGRWQQFIRDDPLALHSATVSFLHASLALDRLAAEAPARIRKPVLLMLAGHDRIIDNKKTERYFQRIASTQRTLIEYPAAQHTLEFEPNREQIVDDLLEWLDRVRLTC